MRVLRCSVLYNCAEQKLVSAAAVKIFLVGWQKLFVCYKNRIYRMQVKSWDEIPSSCLAVEPAETHPAHLV